jgi:hypothetical protein
LVAEAMAVWRAERERGRAGDFVRVIGNVAQH